MFTAFVRHFFLIFLHCMSLFFLAGRIFFRSSSFRWMYTIGIEPNVETRLKCVFIKFKTKQVSYRFQRFLIDGTKHIFVSSVEFSLLLLFCCIYVWIKPHTIDFNLFFVRAVISIRVACEFDRFVCNAHGQSTLEWNKMNAFWRRRAAYKYFLRIWSISCDLIFGWGISNVNSWNEPPGNANNHQYFL